ANQRGNSEMRIVLIRPTDANRIWVGIPRFFNNGIFLFPPLGIMQLKAHIERHTSHEVYLYDCLIHKADYEKLGGFIKGYKPDVVGISAFTHSLIDVVQSAKVVKDIEPSIHVVIGGPHTYTFPEESRYLIDGGCVDSILLGDGEENLVRLIEAIEKKEEPSGIEGIIYRNKEGRVIRRGRPVYLKDLDSISFPSRDIPGIKSYYTPASHGRTMTTMITSRGCPYSCKFCNVQRQYRSRSVVNIVDEMEDCRDKGFKEIFFIDDTFNVTKDRVAGLCEEIIKRGLDVKWGCKARCDQVDAKTLELAKRAGCVRMHYGVETGEPQGLDSIDKRVSPERIMEAFVESKRARIRTVAYFIIGCPHEKNIADVLRTIRFAQKIPADFAVFSLLSPYPDAQFYKEGVEKNVFDPKPWAEFLRNPSPDTALPTCWEEHFTKEELLYLLKIAHRKFYYRPSTILNALFNIHSATELKRIVGGGASLMKLELLATPHGRI
ncbi:MAG: cobalamin-dependent protein, partial [Candidatus Omnitrophica bacterium]|nr:cobalamin-dependent protein [Candidatus Omnitrophota bacterium]